MKTKVDLDPELLARAKQKAAETGVSIESIIEKALRLYLNSIDLKHNQIVTTAYGKLGSVSQPNELPSGEVEMDQDDYWIKRFGFVPK
jgi:Ribbon-helix-helix protein, copG family